MTGPEHFEKGEYYLRLSEQASDARTWEKARTYAEQASAHFAAAQVAATIDAVAARGPGDVSLDWDKVRGIGPRD